MYIYLINAGFFSAVDFMLFTFDTNVESASDTLLFDAHIILRSSVPNFFKFEVTSY